MRKTYAVAGLGSDVEAVVAAPLGKRAAAVVLAGFALTRVYCPGRHALHCDHIGAA